MFFISSKRSRTILPLGDKCAICSERIKIRYNPMKEWSVKGPLCGDCYSKQIHDFYPGEHVRVNKDLD